MASKMIYGPLDWDTEFFGITSGRVTIEEGVTLSELEELFKLLDEFEFTTVVNKGNQAQVNQWLGEKTDSFLVDVNVQFSKEVGAEQRDNSHIVVSSQRKPDEMLLDLARQSFVHSRFFNDPYLDKEKAKAIYSQWVLSAFNQENKYFIEYRIQEECLGFLLFSINRDTCVIELIAARPNRTHQGVGTALLQGLDHYLSQKTEVKTINVGTQVNNLPAIRFYTKNGFILQGGASIYHHWKK